MQSIDRSLVCLAFVTASLLTGTSAHAAAGLTATTVNAVSSTVSYSTDPSGNKAGQTIYAGYQLSTANTSGNTINNVNVEATAVVADPQEFAQFVASDGTDCQLSTPPAGSPDNAVTVSCYIGQMRAGVARTFFLFYKAPVQDTVSPMATGDYIGLQGRTITAEGANAGNSPNDSVDFWPLSGQMPAPDTCAGGSIETPTATTHLCIRVLLGTPSAVQVKSAVPKSGGTFFTGQGGIPGYVIDGVTDVFTTTVTVPTSSIIASATENEGPTQSVNVTCSNFYNCYSATLTIVDTQTLDAFGNPVTADYSPAYLRIVVRMDSTNIRPGTKIGNVKVYYNGTSVDNCPSPTTPIGGGVPCIAQRTAYKQNAKGVDPALWGDFEWVILNNKNGVLEFF